MNFTKVNIINNFYKYMITDTQKIFSDFTPGGLDEEHYQQKLKHKFQNEFNNKIKYLKS